MREKRNRFLYGMTATELEALAAVINDPRFDELTVETCGVIGDDPRKQSRSTLEAAERAWAKGEGQ